MIEVLVCCNASVGINKAVLWRVQCNRARNRSSGEDIMVVRCPVRCLGIVRCDRSCMLEQWATIHRNGKIHITLKDPNTGLVQQYFTKGRADRKKVKATTTGF
jgi:hypothetical protein